MRNCQTNLAGKPKALLEEYTASCDFVNVWPREVLDRSSSGLKLSFHIKAVKTIRENFSIAQHLQKCICQ